MRFHFLSIFVLSLFGTMLYSCSTNIDNIVNYDVIPLPHSVEVQSGNGFELNNATQIFCSDTSSQALGTARFLAEYITLSTGNVLPVGVQNAEVDASNIILLKTDNTITNPEGYKIDVNEDQIVVSAGDYAGLFYAVQTLRKAMPVNIEGDKLIFPAVSMSDYPRFAYRGTMLDVSRSFYPIEFLKKFVDLLALHNLNTFHLHLTDDQGWRIEIKKYPKLTEIGSVRPDSVSGTYGGYYTQEQITDLVEYAQNRFITIIPEIDLPGHLESALAAYPEYGCTGGPYSVNSNPGVRADILCVGNPQSLPFVQDVLAEVIELFPSKYIHIGGDEVPRTRWCECAKCQALIRKLGLKDTKEHSAEDQLQGYFNTQIEAFVEDKGRKIIGWDEIVDGGLSPRATVMSWRSAGGGIRAAKLGHDVVMAMQGNLYLNSYQSINTEDEPLAGGHLSMAKVYSTEPIAADLTVDEQKHILGAQACLWTTWMPTPESVEYMLLPRLAAFSEVVWSDPAQRDFTGLLNRMPMMIAFYKSLECNNATHLFTVDVEFIRDLESKELKVALSSAYGSSIYYTLDGTTPTANSKLYKDTMSITKNADLRAMAILPNGLISEVLKKEIKINKATLKPIKAMTTPDARYKVESLNDGVGGYPVFYFGSYWTGYYGIDLDVVVDMLEPTEITQFETTTLTDFGSHIADASAISVFSSEDGVNFSKVAEKKLPEIVFTMDRKINKHILEFEPITTRYVRIIVENAKEFPRCFLLTDGLSPFLFVDEISLT